MEGKKVSMDERNNSQKYEHVINFDSKYIGLYIGNKGNRRALEIRPNGACTKKFA